VAVEGPDGAGKSTQARLLAARLADAGWEVMSVREPGGTDTGERVRGVLLDPALGAMVPWAELFLFMASRSQLVAERIAPALRAGRAVVSDRFLLSSVAYQGVVGGVGPGRVVRMAREAFGEWFPDLTVVIDVPAGRGLGRNRRHGRAADRVESKGLAYARRVRAAFLAERRRCGRSAVVDVRGPVEDVAEAVWREVQRVL
jgi:dTMP kinase